MNKDLSKILSELKGSGIHSILIDGKPLGIEQVEESLIGEEIRLVSANRSLTLWLDDIPHFEGDAILEFSWDASDAVTHLTKIGRIRLWEAKPKGLRLFAPSCIVQLELELEPDKWLSVGLFQQSGGKPEFLSTGDVTVSLGAGLTESKKLNIMYEL